MLIAAAALGERRRLAAGPLAPLADSLAADLLALSRTDTLSVPRRKARLTRDGGRCPQCGTILEVDPWSPQRHRCARCDKTVVGDEHDGMWIMWYQLWLAERAVHAAALFAARGDVAHRKLAERILAVYSDRYLSYPNRDNVLGPTRPFFSTYLESIWTLQLACALDVLEAAGAHSTLGATVRSDLLAPSAALIAEYDEGLSNRQVWNNAALLACALLLGDAGMAQRAVMGRSGLLTHLEHGLLADGTWYEGENYHLFAHRGLWYGVTLAEHAGLEVPAELRARYLRAFETPFLSALPDFTFPSRRDSPYRVSLRQWRIAESCELGLAATPSDVLAAALRELYRSDGPRGDTGRDRSTAEAERNVPASRLTRADLGWKSLLFAPEAEPSVESAAPLGSVLLPDQGFAILRRNDARTYVALDYGESGGGHGHPDRLNLWLVVGEARILEDVGTGSYVDPSLHWYRSTLAHNAPLACGRSQLRVDGELLAYDDQGDFGWALARAALAPNVIAERAVVVASDYLVDELLWVGAQDTVIDLPYHIAASETSVASWTDATMDGGDGLADGFSHLTHSAHSEPIIVATLAGIIGDVAVKLWIVGDTPIALWRLRAPGPPNEPPRELLVVRAGGAVGRIRTVIDWTGAATEVERTDERLVVVRTDGSQHAHARREDEWHISAGDRKRVVLTTGLRKVPEREYVEAPLREAHPDVLIPHLVSIDPEPGILTHDGAMAARFRLGANHYRRSEQNWEQAGRPQATIAFAATAGELHIDIAVEKPSLAFAPQRPENALDNEHPDVNSDGVQLYLSSWIWLLVPEQPAPNVRVTPRHSTDSNRAPELPARWTATPRGYSMRIVLPLDAVAGANGSFFGDVIVNEMPPPPERERRRGQLVLSGARGEWVYLRGDRQDPSRFLRFVLADA